MFTNWGVDILGSLLNSEWIQWCVSSLADCNLSISQPSGRYGNHSIYSSSVIVLSLVVLCFVESCPIQLKNEPKTQSHPCVYFWNSFFSIYLLFWFAFLQIPVTSTSSIFDFCLLYSVSPHVLPEFPFPKWQSEKCLLDIMSSSHLFPFTQGS